MGQYGYRQWSSHLNEFIATLNSPGLSQPSFSAIETDIGKWWHDVLLADMLAAGQEERRLAIERKITMKRFLL